MAGNKRVSNKKVQIDKASSTIVIVVGIASFLITFSAVSIQALMTRRAYQAKVISEQEKARDQLISNIEAVDKLKVKYNEFVDRQENVIGGDSQGSGGSDGDNARIILDALPSKYDFPALVSSLEKILTDRNYSIKSITGTDNEANLEEGGGDSGSPVEMPFEVAAESSYKGTIDLLDVFSKSIRPIKIDAITLSAGDSGSAEIDITGKSYFLPERNLDVKEELVK